MCPVGGRGHSLINPGGVRPRDTHQVVRIFDVRARVFSVVLSWWCTSEGHPLRYRAVLCDILVHFCEVLPDPGV